MTPKIPHSAGVIGLTVFLVVATAAQVGVSTFYAIGARQLGAAQSIAAQNVRILARPLRVAVGQALPKAKLQAHLHAVGYYSMCDHTPGCFVAEPDALTIWSRFRELPDVRLEWTDGVVTRITTPTGSPLEYTDIEPETIVNDTIDPSGISNRLVSEPIPYSILKDTPLLDAVIASEDRWFFAHHGLDLGRLAIAPLIGSGASTITMQVARQNVLHDRTRTLHRKLNEIGVAMAMERRYSKQTILTAYVNSVYAGARRGRTIHGLAAAAHEYFGVRDVRRIDIIQAATIVALLNQPSRYLNDLDAGGGGRLLRQRNRVLRLLNKNFPERYPGALVKDLEKKPVALSPPEIQPDALQRASRHYLDYAATRAPAVSGGRIYLSLDPDLQRIASDTVTASLADLEARVAPAPGPQLQAALIAVNPHTGEILALVGGREYERSQFNRIISAERQIGSIMKPFVYLAAFERAAVEGRHDLTPSTIVVDEPTVFNFRGLKPWAPANYGHKYAGAITWRQALAESRNVPAVKVSALAGFPRVATLWGAASGRPVRSIFPSIALGAVQATPAEVAEAYTIFATNGVVHPLRAVVAAVEDDRPVHATEAPSRRLARTETTARVTDMMRAVFDQGTAREARASGFTQSAAGKTGTTDGLRDAWFAGFTANLLAVVWVGRDDGLPVGLSGAQAALPIWTEFMKRAHQ